MKAFIITLFITAIFSTSQAQYAHPGGMHPQAQLDFVKKKTGLNVKTFAAGALIYQIGYTMILLLVEVIIADITSTRARLFFSYIPTTPFLIITWVSGNVSQAVLNAIDWRWGAAAGVTPRSACA